MIIPRRQESLNPDLLDVIIVGAGPAGLSAALILGRCRRSVLVCDAGAPRNAASHGLHGFLTRDGILPAELLRLGREQLRSYESVTVCDVEVTDVNLKKTRFIVDLANGQRRESRTLLLATGVVDNIPEVEGIRELYGRSVFHCPYCDGWESRDLPIAVHGRGKRGYGLALELTLWSSDLVLCTDGPAELTAYQRSRLARHGIPLREGAIRRLEGTNGMLERIVFRDGTRLERRALFFSHGQHQRALFAKKLGCKISHKGSVLTGKHERTNVPGLFVTGDASRSVHFAIVAAGEGAQAASEINKLLHRHDLH